MPESHLNLWPFFCVYIYTHIHTYTYVYKLKPMKIRCNVLVSVRASTFFMIESPQVPKEKLSKASLKCLIKTAVATSLLQIEQMCLKSDRLQFRADFAAHSRRWAMAQILTNWFQPSQTRLSVLLLQQGRHRSYKCATKQWQDWETLPALGTLHH